MPNGITLAEETELRLENTILSLRWEIRRLRDRIEDEQENSQRWRNSYENALHYLAILQPNLAEIAEDDHYRIWKAAL